MCSLRPAGSLPPAGLSGAAFAMAGAARSWGPGAARRFGLRTAGRGRLISRPARHRYSAYRSQSARRTLPRPSTPTAGRAFERRRTRAGQRPGEAPALPAHRTRSACHGQSCNGPVCPIRRAVDRRAVLASQAPEACRRRSADAHAPPAWAGTRFRAARGGGMLRPNWRTSRGCTARPGASPMSWSFWARPGCFSRPIWRCTDRSRRRSDGPMRPISRPKTA